jgi:hypothetical protein
LQLTDRESLSAVIVTLTDPDSSVSWQGKAVLHRGR